MKRQCELVARSYVIDFTLPPIIAASVAERRAHMASANAQNDKLLIFRVDDTGAAFGCRLVFTMI